MIWMNMQFGKWLKTLVSAVGFYQPHLLVIVQNLQRPFGCRSRSTTQPCSKPLFPLGGMLAGKDIVYRTLSGDVLYLSSREIVA